MSDLDPSPGMITPFILFLLCIALAPFIVKEHWEKHYHHVSFLLSFIVFLYYVIAFQGDGAVRMVESFLDYFSFMALIGSLYVIASGIHIDIKTHATPLVNVALLATGAVLANIIGTTGASMLLIRPFIRINKSRVKQYHVMFFIFLVGNVGGVLTPLGDPPLFLGYLQGVPFFWLISQPRIIGAWLLVVGYLLIVFFVFDYVSYKNTLKRTMRASFTSSSSLTEDADDVDDSHGMVVKGGKISLNDDEDEEKDDDEMLKVESPSTETSQEDNGRLIQFQGIHNAGFLLLIILLVLAQRVDFVRSIESTKAAVDGIGFLISVLMMGVGLLAWRLGNQEALEANNFNFGPIKEVGLLFFGIFFTMTPALDYLQGNASKLGVEHPMGFYWASGALSSFLDNAPTYLTFLAAAAGLIHDGSLNDVSDYINPDSQFYDPDFVRQVIAISLGSVFFGANTYIGNGPNFMIKNLAEEGGAKCPTFFEYIYKYSGPFLLPIFLVVSFMSVY